MKTFVLFLVLASSCASWKQKDFEKDIDKSAPPTIEVDADKSVLDKFEVKSVGVTPAEPTPAPVVDKKTKTSSKKKIAEIKPVKEPIEIKKGPPADYPAEMLDLNERGKKVWDVYKPNHAVNEKWFLDIHYLGMTVGKIMFVNKGKTTVNGKEAWHFHSRFKSAPFYNNIYELDDTVDTYVTTDKFMSLRYSLIQRESKQSVDDLQLYDRDLFKTYSYYKQKKSNGDIKNKNKEGPIPYYSTDPFSVLFLLQGLPLLDGDVYEVPLVNKSKTLILSSKVEGREKLSTDMGEKTAIRIHATTKYTGETLKSGDMFFWFSDDDKRMLLKVKAKIKIGTVTADIVKG